MASKSLKAAVKTLCIVLVMAFVVTGILFIGKAFAAGESTPPVQTEGQSFSAPVQVDDKDKSSMKGDEDISKRDINNKYFTLENGTKSCKWRYRYVKLSRW